MGGTRHALWRFSWLKLANAPDEVGQFEQNERFQEESPIHQHWRPTGRRLDFEVGREPVEVEIDRERISQVLIHLLFLARTSSPGGVPLKVMLTQTSAEAIVTIQAMEIENLAEHPLERFYRRERGEGQGQREDEGVGLFLVHHLVAQHEGQIQLDTSAPRGRGIALHLPLAAPLPEAISTPFQPPHWLIS